MLHRPIPLQSLLDEARVFKACEAAGKCLGMQLQAVLEAVESEVVELLRFKEGEDLRIMSAEIILAGARHKEIKIVLAAVYIKLSRRPSGVGSVETRHRVFFADSRYMPELEDESIHLIVTSPPYPMIEM